METCCTRGMCSNYEPGANTPDRMKEFLTKWAPAKNQGFLASELCQCGRVNTLDWVAPQCFLSGAILVRDSEAGVGTKLAVVQKYGKQDSGTTEHLPSR